MDEKILENMVRSCTKIPELVEFKGFLLIALDQAVNGIGAGSAFAWVTKTGKWTARPISGINRPPAVQDVADLLEDEDLCDDELLEDWIEMDEDTEPSADYRVLYFRHGADVDFFAHVNRTNDGICIHKDFVSIDWGDGPRMLPIIYWNVGSALLKVDGKKLPPHHRRLSLPFDSPRMARRRSDVRAKQWLMEQYNARIRQIEKEILALRPDCPENLAHRLAMQFYNHYSLASC